MTATYPNAPVPELPPDVWEQIRDLDPDDSGGFPIPNEGIQWLAAMRAEDGAPERLTWVMWKDPGNGRPPDTIPVPFLDQGEWALIKGGALDGAHTIESGGKRYRIVAVGGPDIDPITVQARVEELA